MQYVLNEYAGRSSVYDSIPRATSYNAARVTFGPSADLTLGEPVEDTMAEEDQYPTVRISGNKLVCITCGRAIMAHYSQAEDALRYAKFLLWHSLCEIRMTRPPNSNGSIENSTNENSVAPEASGDGLSGTFVGGGDMGY